MLLELVGDGVRRHCICIGSIDRYNLLLVFYLIAIVTIPFSLLSFIVLPKYIVTEANKGRRLDLPGVTALTAGLILLVYAISDANDGGYCHYFHAESCCC